MNRRKLLGNIVVYFLLVMAVVLTLYPISRIITISIRPGDQIMSTDLSFIPKDATLSNYSQLITKKPFFRWLLNSLKVSGITALLGTGLAISAAYAFSRFSFPGRQRGMVFLLVTQMMPPTILLLPMFILLSTLKLINSYGGMIVTYASTALPFSIWLLKGYFDTVPLEIEEAGWIDGAGVFRTFYELILPLAAPAIGIAFLFSFMTAWSEYIVARVILSKKELLTWPLGLDSLQGQFQTEYGMFAAASLLLSIPVVVLFLYTSKYLISGLTAGSVKN